MSAQSSPRSDIQTEDKVIRRLREDLERAKGVIEKDIKIKRLLVDELRSAKAPRFAVETQT